MKYYMEDKLSGLHATGASSGFKQKAVAFVCGLLLLVFLPYLHIGVFYRMWDQSKPPVNRTKCKCDCFDTVFRGPYEWPPSSYKHMYFNATSNTLKIWFLTVLVVLAVYEIVRYLVPLIYEKKLRTSMFALLLSSIYPHYYGWWNMLMYYNEDFYFQWRHQLFFCLTEAVSTAMVVHLCNVYNRVVSWKLLLIISINAMHVIVGGLDLFLLQIYHHAGARFENVRNLGLLIPDLFHVLVPFFEVQILAERRGVPITQLFYKEEIMMAVLLVILLSIFGRNL